MAATTANTALSMKVLINKKAKRVPFAEASKDVVDFLFSPLAWPVATVVELVGTEAMVGCLGNLYASVVKLGSTTNVLTGAARDVLLCPAVTSPAVALTTGTDSSLLRLAPAPRFVQEQGNVTTYRVMDDLTVDEATPMSAISTISLFSTFPVKNLGDVQEKTVQLGYDEGLAILKASLQSKTVLTDVFLHGNSNNKQVGSSTPVVVGASSRSVSTTPAATPILGTSSGQHEDGVAGRKPRSRKASSRVFGKEWSNDS